MNTCCSKKSLIYFFKYKTIQLAYNWINIFLKIRNCIEGTYLKQGKEQSGDPWLGDEQFFFSKVHPSVSPVQKNTTCHAYIDGQRRRRRGSSYRQILRPVSGVSLKGRLFLSCLHNNKSVRERIQHSSVRMPGTTQPLLLWLANGPTTALIPHQW